MLQAIRDWWHGGGSRVAPRGPVLKWWKAKPNWGDSLNPVLFQHLSGLPSQHIPLDNPRRLPHYMILGSILSWADEASIVWGPGFQRADQQVRGKPRRICAVRGPLSRARLLEQGLSCPEVYGDPALLFPRCYRPSVPPRYELGVVPHYVDKKHPWLRNLRSRPEVLVIDVGSDVCDYVDQIVSCRAIASSSLHGLIAADAYGVPSVWLELSDKVHGHGFKFRDYFLSVGRPLRPPLQVTSDTRVEDVLDRVEDVCVQCDLTALWDACPFLRTHDDPVTVGETQPCACL